MVTERFRRSRASPARACGDKRGRAHLHVVFCRVHPLTLKVARDSHNYRIHEQTSRALEERLQLRPIIGAHTRPKGTRRPVALATHADWQTQERTGVSVQQVADALRHAWNSTTTARAFQRAVEAEGWCLANGRRGIVLVDQAGTPHSIPRRLQLRAAEVHKRLATVEDAKKGNRPMPRTNKFTASRGRRRQADPELMPTNPAPLSADYWLGLGYTVETFDTHLTVALSPNTKMHDYGDTLTLERAGEPTDEEIRIMVAAGKARGWQEIRFFGGSEEFQGRARLEALRQGYRMDQISLECEDGKPRPLAALPIPEHIRKKIQPPAAPEQMPTPSVPVPEAPAPEFRP